MRCNISCSLSSFANDIWYSHYELAKRDKIVLIRNKDVKYPM